MLFQQAFSYACQMVMPVLADRLADDFGISRGWLGLYLLIQNLFAILAAVGCGGFILRYGPLRVSQVVLFLMAGSLLVVSTGILWLYPLGAILLGLSAVSTPASSHILARVCPPRLAPLIFSVKQTGVPVGSLIGGLLLPSLLGLVFYSATLGTTVRVGTYGTAIGTAIIVIGVGLLLQPIREYFDSERRPETKLSLGDLPQTMRSVVGDPALRDISFAAFAFGGLQSLFAGFFILYMIDGLGFSEIQAGSVYAVSSFSAIFARIAWGVLGSSWTTPRIVLGLIGLFGGLSALMITQLDGSWTLVEITVVAIVYNMTAISWHGILLAETARLAPADQVGGITGGVLSFTSVAMMTYPAIYGILLAVTDSYKTGFLLASVPAFLAFLMFMRPPLQGAWTSVFVNAGRSVLTWQGGIAAVGVTVLGLSLGLWAFSARWWQML